MITYRPIIQPVSLADGLQTDVLRLDLIDKNIPGNKWFKLKYNLQEAAKSGLTTILTFGGAFSNHILATSAACKLAGYKCIGVIRGEKVEPLNPTLAEAEKNGMQLFFVTREQYSKKDDPAFLDLLKSRFGSYYFIPEGGNNLSGVKGCMEILDPSWNYNYIFCACGTGTTFAGLAAASKPTQHIIGINILKGKNELLQDVRHQLAEMKIKKEILGNEELDRSTLHADCVTDRFAFSGYAKVDQELIAFKKEFERSFQIPLDHIYTTKLFYAVSTLSKQGKFGPHDRLLIIHTGGQQSNRSFEERYRLR